MNTLSGGVAGNHLEQRNRHAPIGEDLDLAARRALRRRLLTKQVADAVGEALEQGALARSRNPALRRGLGYLLAVCRLRLATTSFTNAFPYSASVICFEPTVYSFGDFACGEGFVKGFFKAFMKPILLHFRQVFKRHFGLRPLPAGVVHEGKGDARVVLESAGKAADRAGCPDMRFGVLREWDRPAATVLLFHPVSARQRAPAQGLNRIAIGVDEHSLAWMFSA